MRSHVVYIRFDRNARTLPASSRDDRRFEESRCYCPIRGESADQDDQYLLRNRANSEQGYLEESRRMAFRFHIIATPAESKGKPDRFHCGERVLEMPPFGKDLITIAVRLVYRFRTLRTAYARVRVLLSNRLGYQAMRFHLFRRGKRAGCNSRTVLAHPG
jgi:hypothetical protein